MKPCRRTSINKGWDSHCRPSLAEQMTRCQIAIMKNHLWKIPPLARIPSSLHGPANSLFSHTSHGYMEQQQNKDTHTHGNRMVAKWKAEVYLIPRFQRAVLFTSGCAHELILQVRVNLPWFAPKWSLCLSLSEAFGVGGCLGGWVFLSAASTDCGFVQSPACGKVCSSKNRRCKQKKDFQEWPTLPHLPHS